MQDNVDYHVNATEKIKTGHIRYLLLLSIFVNVNVNLFMLLI